MTCRSIGLWMALVAVAGCSGEPALVRQMRKEHLINAIRQRLFESVEAEKSAVLATTDEESQALALEVQHSATDINRLRGELRPLIVADGRHEEIEKLDAFDATWTELEGVDHRLLALAVANTNLKAARLSAREGVAALDRFVDALTEMQRSATEPEMIRTLSRASVAALRGQSLLLVHIPTADEAEMTRLEQRMGTLSDEVDRNLASARESGAPLPQQLATASQAWSEYRRIAADVLRLSRENTNVISFDVSVHEKRQATKECLSALSALLAAVESGSPATR
jgi:hypothetical protein